MNRCVDAPYIFFSSLFIYLNRFDCQFGFGVKKKYYCIKTLHHHFGQINVKHFPFFMHFQDVIQILVSMHTAKPKYGMLGSKVVIRNNSLV